MFKRDHKALKRRLDHFKQVPELNWWMLDQRRQFWYRNDRKKRANELGYKYISEATVKLYYKFMSYRKTSEILGLSSEGTLRELRSYGIKLQKKGGWRPGEKRSPALFYNRKKYRVLINE